MTLSEAANKEAADMLGLRATPRSPLEWVETVRHGLPAKASERLAARLKWPGDRLARATGLSVRTIQRDKKRTKMSPERTERVVRLAMVYARAREVFADDAATWLESPLLSLGNRAPLGFLDTDLGTQLVLNELTVIEYGMGA